MSRKPSKAVQELQSQVSDLQKVIEAQANRIDLSEKARVWLRLAQAGSGQSAYRSTTFGGTGVFSPGEPVLPVDPEVEPRLYEYGTGENLVFIPRAGYGLLSYQVLRNLAALSKEIRLNIEKIKQIIRGFEWDIIFEGPEVEVAGIMYQATPDLDRVKHFWEKPDGIHDFDSWLAIVLEEILVTDSLTLYPNTAGDFMLEVVDGTTIRPLIDFHGRTPVHPAPAYIQVLHGMPMSYYSTQGILYSPRNPKVYTPYGESPIEWVIQMIVQSIKHDLGRTTYFTEGNVPGAFAGLPDEWTVQQIQEFSEWYNTLLEGDTGKAHKMMFIPHSGSSLPIHEFNQTSFADPAIDEWLMTIACWAFGNSPSEFGLTRGEGLGGGGYMDAGENSQFRGVTGIAKFLTRVINRINKEYLDAPWAKFKWKELDPVEDKSTEADVHLKYLDKVYNVAYVQDQLGIPEKYRVTAPPSPDPFARPPLQPGVMDQYPSQMVPPPFMKALQDEFKLWKKFTKDSKRKNWPLKKFTSEIIPRDILDETHTALKSASTAQIDSIFEDALQKITTPKNPHEAVVKQLETELTDTVAQYLLEAQGRLERQLNAGSH